MSRTYYATTFINKWTRDIDYSTIEDTKARYPSETINKHNKIWGVPRLKNSIGIDCKCFIVTIQE